MKGRRLRDIFRGDIISLAIEEHRLPDGRRVPFEIVRHSGGAAVLPLFADGQVMLIRQFRAAVGGTLLEIPAGRLEPGEDPEVCARRELREEAGLEAGTLERIGGMYPTIGFCDERVHLFVARGLSEVARAPEHDEFIEPVLLPLPEALRMVRAGEIPDAKTQLALLLHAAGEGGSSCR